MHPENLRDRLNSLGHCTVRQGCGVSIIYVIYCFHSSVDEEQSLLDYNAVLTDSLLPSFERFLFSPLFAIVQEEFLS